MNSIIRFYFCNYWGLNYFFLLYACVYFVFTFQCLFKLHLYVVVLSFVVLKKIQVQFVDTCVTLKHENPGAPNGIALEMRIKNLEYTDEAGSDPTGPVEKTEPSKETTPAAFSTKNLYLEGVTFYMAEYLCSNKTNPENASKESTPDSKV